MRNSGTRAGQPIGSPRYLAREQTDDATRAPINGFKFLRELGGSVDDVSRRSAYPEREP